MKFDIEDPKFREVIKEIVKSKIQKVVKDQEKNGFPDIVAVKQLENIESTIKKYESANRFAKFLGFGSSAAAKKSFKSEFKQDFENILEKGGYKVNNERVEEVYESKFKVRTHEYAGAGLSSQKPSADVYAVPEPNYNSVVLSRNSTAKDQTYAAGAVPPTSNYDATRAPHESDKPAFQARSNIQYTGLSTTNSDNVYVEIGLTPTPSPSVSPINPQAQSSLHDVVLNQFGTPKGGIYGDTSGLSAADAEANKRAYEAEIAKQEQQRAASPPPQAPALAPAAGLANSAPRLLPQRPAELSAASAPPQAPVRAPAASLASSAPPAFQIHQTPISAETRATYQPSSIVQQYTGASSVQTQPLVPEKKQLPTPTATNVGSSKVSPAIAALAQAMNGGINTTPAVAQHKRTVTPQTEYGNTSQLTGSGKPVLGPNTQGLVGQGQGSIGKGGRGGN